MLLPSSIPPLFWDPRKHQELERTASFEVQEAEAIVDIL